ncbi:MAG TPA: M1 family aminopeptidase [Pseudonocardiaceae bacterium]|jgi:aminopeptidase N|nr:M1 family aminopeptidase [Pseudonocardiaceae bacterium]
MEDLRYAIDLDLDRASDTIPARTTIRFRAEPGEDAVADLDATTVHRITLNGRPLDPAQVWQRPHLHLADLAANNVVEVDAEFPISDERGYRQVSATDTEPAYTYGAAYPRFAPRCFCCFDDPTRRAPVDLRIWAPPDISCLANAPLAERAEADGRIGWRLSTSAPIPPYAFTMAAGPWAQLHRADDPTPIGVYARRSRGGQLDRGREIADLAGRALRDYERILGVPFAYRKCDLMLVPDLPSLAYSPPGIIMLRETVLDAGPRFRPIVIAHEVGHQWFGGTAEFIDRADDWLIEALTSYVSRLLVVDWGLAPGAGEPRPDAGYEAELIVELAEDIGQAAVLAGLRAFCQRFTNGGATRADLVACWSQASGRDLTGWAADRS